MANIVFDSCGISIFEKMLRLACSWTRLVSGRAFRELEPKEVVEAATRALRDGPRQYPPMLGLPALGQVVANNVGRFLDLDVDWERKVLVTSGATEALADAFSHCFAKEHETLEAALARLSRWTRLAGLRAAS